MKNILLKWIVLTGMLTIVRTGLVKSQTAQSRPESLADFHQLLENYYQQILIFDPVTATLTGDHRYDDRLSNDISTPFLQKKYAYDRQLLRQLQQFDTSRFNTTDKISYSNLKELVSLDLSKSKYHFEYLPVNQFFCMPLLMGQLGAGGAGQPFSTPDDYRKWLRRVGDFIQWMDTAKSNMKKGMATGIVLPKLLVQKMIPQMRNLGKADQAKNIFYNPVRNMPATFTAAQKQQIKTAFDQIIAQKLLPCYRDFALFLSKTYLPKAQEAAGLYALPGGMDMYKIYIRQYTTTDKSPDEIYQTGLQEVARIQKQMTNIKDKVGFKGTLSSFFSYLRTNKKFMPFTEPEQVLQAYRDIYAKIKPHLTDYFDVKPKNSFIIRRVEAYREAGQNGPSYMIGSLKDHRPGTFYVPVVDASKINVTFLGMEATFLHEAIPGHHYQISLQMENEQLPTFRHQINFSAFMEGWALYVETLGKELGCYTDPYQQMGALNNDIHRAIRLVADVGIHSGKLSKEEAVRYMLAHESISKEDAELSVERYMGFPGQALSYKMGALEILDIKKACQKALGEDFNIKDFHHALLSQGDMPLSVLRTYMEDWVQQRQK